jgi:hypothetical protein
MGLDVHTETIAVAYGAAEREAEVVSLGGVAEMTNQWLSDTLGLVSIRTLWISLHIRPEPPSADPHARRCGLSITHNFL